MEATFAFDPLASYLDFYNKQIIIKLRTTGQAGQSGATGWSIIEK
jgi:hypothetical protein